MCLCNRAGAWRSGRHLYWSPAVYLEAFKQALSNTGQTVSNLHSSVLAQASAPHWPAGRLAGWLGQVYAALAQALVRGRPCSYHPALWKASQSCGFGFWTRTKFLCPQMLLNGQILCQFLQETGQMIHLGCGQRVSSHRCHDKKFQPATLMRTDQNEE